MHRLLLGLVLALVACSGAPKDPEVPVDPSPVEPDVAPTASPEQPESLPEPAPPKAGPRIDHLDGTNIRFEGGDGSSKENAIVIVGAQNSMDGVAAEYGYLEAVFGPRGAAWQMQQQALLNEDGKKYDALTIERDGKAETYYFDITAFFGKF